MVHSTPAGERAALEVIASSLEALTEAPDEAETLVDVVEWHVQRHPDRPHIVLHEEGEQRLTMTYGDLMTEARAVAAGLREHGLNPGQPVGLMLPTCREYFGAWFGIMLAGGIPTPLYPPGRLSRIEEHMRRQAGILANAQAPFLVTGGEVKRVGTILKALVPDMKEVLTVADLASGGGVPDRLRHAASDIAFLQYTSGSTGNPKGVVLTHANLLANIRAMVGDSGVSPSDVFVSWLPLYHDMGLIGAWLTCMYLGVRTVIMSPLHFLARPERWLRAIHTEGGTISASPNFAYDLCSNKIQDAAVQGIDLSRWRLALNGAEFVHASTVDRFCRRFASCGFRREAMTPVYGMAECSLGLAFPPMDRGPRIDRIRRDLFQREGRAEPAAEGDAAALSFVSCGSPIVGHEIRIVDDSGKELGERRVGRVQFRGPSATSGYYRNPEATAVLVKGDWLEPGDNGYFAGGEIHVVGRTRDMIIRGGRNLHPQDVEEAVETLEGVRPGGVAVFGSPDPITGTERVIVVAETRETGESRERLVERIREIAADHLESPPDDVVPVPPRTVPKTPSGKIQRSACRLRYERGELVGGSRGVVFQFMQLAASSVGPRFRRTFRAVMDRAYASYVQALFGFSAFFIGLAVLTSPSVRRRRIAVRSVTRTFLRLAGLPVRVVGLDYLPSDRPCLIVANHCSFLDAVLLSAVLPVRFGFVGKRELLRNPVLGRFFSRLGMLFVERFDAERGREDTAVVLDALKRGESLVIFPEGTFTRAPGLSPFRMGAFLVAAQAGVTVVPLAHRGTRSVLRDVSWFPRRGALDVVIGSSMEPEGEEWAAAIRLRDATRAAILRECGEPDLVGGG